MVKRIQTSQISCPKPDFKKISLPKEKVVLNWLIEWCHASIESGELSYGMFLPLKSELASFLGVSVGTVQNAIRYAEDLGYFESKQSVGTMLKDPKSDDKIFNKMFSKKDVATNALKKYILENKVKIGSNLPDLRTLSRVIGYHTNTTRLALESLVAEGCLRKESDKGNKINWIYQNKIENVCDKKSSDEPKNITLTEQITEKIKDYIVANYSKGDKIIPNESFAKMFKVSIRTVNEATKILNEQKIILSRRGRYGTIYLNDPNKIERQKEREEKSIFMSRGRGETYAPSYLYSWEKALDALKKYITQNHESGDKIPPMKDLAQILSVSTNTVKRAVSILCDEGYLITQRGKYGGVFVLETPQKESEAFTWLALNPDVIKLKNRK